MTLTRMRDGSLVGDPRLGRLVDLDPRNWDYPVRTLLQQRAHTPRSYTWRISTAPVLDQGREGACVGFAWAAELAARPAEVEGVSDAVALELYRRAQVLDQWEGEAYSGTSVLAGAQVLRERGFIEEFRWAFSLEDVVITLGYHGPVVFGIPWYSSMYYTDANGFVQVAGELVGGHAILGRAVKCVWPDNVPVAMRSYANLDIDASYVTWRNSWGPDYGTNGDGKVSLRSLARLLAEQGESCVPILRVSP